jgi:rubrerythrin
MGLFAFAKEIESEGAAFYAKLAEKTENEELRSIFNFLSAEETRHYQIFDAWEKNAEPPPQHAEDDLGKARAAFVRLTAHFRTTSVPALNRSEAYQKAAEIERKSISLYTQTLAGLSLLKQREVLKKIIEQENTHLELITSLIEFQRHPGEWLENAEFTHRDEY